MVFTKLLTHFMNNNKLLNILFCCRVLEALWDALKEKIEEGALDWIELEFSVMALRRL